MKIEYDIEQTELTVKFQFNAFMGEECGNSFSHTKTYVKDFKVGLERTILDIVCELEDKYFTLLGKVFGDLENLFQNIRMVTPVTGEGLRWDSSKMAKIKIIQEIQKTKE